MAIADKKIYFLFPGQGAQYPGMALDLWEDSAAVKGLFEIASDNAGRDMKALLQNAGEETLKGTDVSQPAVTLANLAAAAYLGERGIRPAGCAGFSLGEYAALVTAGIIGPEDCFRLVKARGEAMQAATDRIRRESPGGEAPGMAAVIGLEPERVLALIAEWTAAGLRDLYPANINSPRQLVVAGTAAALAGAEEKFKAAGARRFIRLQVAGPFHSPLIRDAAEAFAQTLAAVPFRDPLIPLYSNVSGGPVRTGAEAKKFALDQITSPVRWVEEEGAINHPEGPEAVLETGPGKVLQGLWKDSGSGIPCYAAGTAADIKLLLG
ncbi:MAG: ACP S-malonyltransferase [Treponema sp.]|jgi:[acyl-carrier-protein] S-malonyltransferase|nr:ACP S-malonyltransferase [Treponema sp.]